MNAIRPISPAETSAIQSIKPKGLLQRIIEGLASLVFGKAVHFTPPTKPLPAPLPKDMLKFNLKKQAIPLKPLKPVPAAPSVQKETESDPLDLTNAEKLLTGSNLIQWTLIGASFLGAPSSIILPISALSSFGSELATFFTLPKDASWLRIAMSIPILSRLLINYNPWIARVFQITSIYNLAQNSLSKIGAAFQRITEAPYKAVKAIGAHLFNLASGAIFAAGGAGLIRVKPPYPKECAPRAKANLDCSNCGMFAIALYLVGLLDRHEYGKYSRVKIDFEKEGLYYDPKRGPNWFEYYFNPVDVGDVDCLDADERSFNNHELGIFSSYAERVYGFEQSGLPRDRAKALIEKYLVLKPEIQGEIDAFKNAHFSDSDYVVGVHYRGTDKASEARRVSYDEMTSKIRDQIGELPASAKVKIFAASDEEGFIKHLGSQFPNQVVPSPSRRSTDGQPLHFNTKDPYQTGKEALIDSWLLGTLSDVLVRTSSNLSKFSAFLLKKGAQEVEVSKRHYQDVRTS